MTNVEPSYSHRGLLARWSAFAFALFLVGSNSFVIAGVLPEISHSLGVSSSELGYTITLYAIVVAVLSPALAVALPRTSRTTLMVGGLLAFVIGVVIAALATDFTVFAIGRIVAAVGGAALVPTATAAGAAITPPARRGQAIAVVGIGFTLASAIGAPLGTVLAAATDWRVPMLVIAALALVTAPVLALGVRRVPIGEPISLRRRFAILRDGRILMPLLTTLLIAGGFNMVYIFSSEVTGTSGATLAGLLLVYGILGIIGNTISGPLTDRFGSRRVGAGFAILEVVALAGIALVGSNAVALVIAIAVWGLSAFASVIPVQHRLLAVDPRVAAVAISWFSTALYIGIAVAPVAGAAALAAGLPPLIPLIGAGLTVLGLAAFLIGYRLREPGAPAAVGSPARDGSPATASPVTASTPAQELAAFELAEER